MSPDIVIAIAMTVIAAATPILLAGIGELVAERAGVLNLGVEGMMLIGAVSGFAVASVTGVPFLGVAAAGLAGVAASLLFALLALGLTANQVATGLALTIFGIGLSALMGEGFVGRTVPTLGPVFPAGLAEHAIGRLLFGHDVLVYLSLAMAGGTAVFLSATRAGLVLRAVGEAHDSAHSIGYPVLLIRTAAVAFGGLMAGIAGSAYSLVLTPMWAEELTAGRGWIALALVVFSGWRPWRLVLGAYLFGLVMVLELHAQAAGLSALPSEFLAATPYLATIFVLVVISSRRGGVSHAPACLGKPFKPTA